MERVKLKEISAKTTVKAIITGFVSYGIIAIFISLLVFALGDYLLSQFSSNNVNGLYITLPLIAAIFIYFTIPFGVIRCFHSVKFGNSIRWNSEFSFGEILKKYKKLLISLLIRLLRSLFIIFFLLLVLSFFG